MSEEKENELTERKKGKEVVATPHWLPRIWQKVSGLQKYGWYVAVALVAYLAGSSYWGVRSIIRYLIGGSYSAEPSHRHPSRDRSARSAVLGCQLYPQDPVCQAAMQPGREIVDTESCFVPRGSTVEVSDLADLPSECRKFGPLSEFIDLGDLKAGVPELKPVTEVPLGIRPHFEKANARLSVKSALVTFLVLSKANGENGAQLIKESNLAPVLTELSLAPDDGLTEEERMTAGQMLSIYNAFVTLLGHQITEEREKIAKECAGYADKDLVPVRCVLVKPSISPPLPSTSL